MFEHFFLQLYTKLYICQVLQSLLFIVSLIKGPRSQHLTRESGVRMPWGSDRGSGKLFSILDINIFQVKALIGSPDGKINCCKLEDFWLAP